VHILSTVVELPLINLSTVSVLFAPFTADEIMEHWGKMKTNDPIKNTIEIEELEAVPIDHIPTNVDAAHNVRGWADQRFVPLHPTARIRLAMLARFLANRRINV
jgi:hypothetical protein